MRDAFAASKLGKAAAAELAEPPERTEKGAARHDLHHTLAHPQQWRRLGGSLEGTICLVFCNQGPRNLAITIGIMYSLLSPRFLPRCPGRATLVHTKFALSWWRSFKACMRRELTLFYRNRVVRSLS